MPRIKTTDAASWPTLPAVPDGLAEAIEDLLQEAYNLNRPPSETAKVLALVVTLAEQKPPLPWPARPHVAAHLDCSKWTVDVALNTALSRGLINLEMEILEGGVVRRHTSVVLQKYYTPGDELLTIARQVRIGRP